MSFDNTKEEKIMAVNFIGPLIMLIGVASLAGIVTGLVKKDKKITTVSGVAFIIIVLIFLVEGLFME